MIDRYQVLGTLGEGAMGEVLRARDERLGREVAIKRVKNVFGGASESFHARFEAEARALAALAHPGIVQVFDLGFDEGAPYLVMELVDGPTLRALLKEHGPLSVTATRALGVQLARALEAAHARGILHRDIKPANVLKAPGEVWKLVDFGVARLPDSEMTQAGQFIGTPVYAAPESLGLGSFSPASDVFGLAATLVEASTGALPRRQARDPIALDAVPADLVPILARALVADPTARPTAAALAAMLAGGGVPEPVRRAPVPVVVEPDLGTVAVPDETIVPVAPRRSLRPLLAGGGILLALVGVAVLGIRLGSGGMTPAPPAQTTPAPAKAPSPKQQPAPYKPQGSQPLRFEMPPNLDKKGFEDWAKIARDVGRGEYGDAFGRLLDFERRHGESAESARLRGWLEQFIEED